MTSPRLRRSLPGTGSGPVDRPYGPGGLRHAVSPAAGVVGVRDSKDPAGPALTFTPTAWRDFVARVASRS
nr:DUF397 domain-containing protein [Micromonospora sp. RTGN7]